MSYETSSSSEGRWSGRDDTPPTPFGLLAEHWGLVMAYGVISLGLGVTLAVWPDETLKVVAILIGIQFLVSGFVRIIGAIAATRLDTAYRVLLAVTGAIAFIVGLLCLRDPLQTLLAITIILGVWWVASGLIDVVGAFISPVPGRRGWDIASGVVSVIAGGFLLIDPNLSLGVLVLVTCLWLIVTGVVAIVAALRLRARRTPEASAAPTSPPEPAL